MNILVAVLLTIIAVANAFVIFAIAYNLKRFKKNARMGGLIILLCLIVDLLAVAGGVALW